MSWDWRGDFREFVKMIGDSRKARKRYPRKDRQSLLRVDILVLAAKAEAQGDVGVWGSSVAESTKMGSAHVYQALAALSRDGYLNRIQTDLLPPIRYVLTKEGRDFMLSRERNR